MERVEHMTDVEQFAEIWSKAKQKLPPARARELERELYHIVNIALLMQHAQENVVASAG